jgi:hypothetical protein
MTGRKKACWVTFAGAFNLYSFFEIICMGNLMLEFWIQLAATLAGGIILTILFFLMKEVVFPLPVVNGLWTFEATTISTSYNPYKQMKVTYLILLIQQGNMLSGTGEKIKEIADGKQHEYPSEKRIHIEIKGQITKRYFAKDQITFHIIEYGLKRKSSTVHSLRLINKNQLVGPFVSTIATSIGDVVWTRDNSEYQFSDKT